MKTSLLRDERGATAVELALALPILLTMLYGIFIIGLLFEANASLQHSLGQGARQATLWSTPDDTTIATTIENSRFPMAYGTFGAPSVTKPANNQRLLTVTYTVTPNFIFFTAPAITMTKSKLVRTIAP